MGTSASSSGPGSGVPLVPPWVSAPDSHQPTPTDAQNLEQEGQEGGVENQPQIPLEVAPAGRFRGTRFNLGQYASSGSDTSMKRGLRHYVRSGLGGSKRASQRMARTARNAGTLFGVLHALSMGTTSPIDLGIEVAKLAGRPAREIVDRIAIALSPSDGTLDSEANRQSITQAFSEFLKREPDADLTHLSEQQIELVMELYIANDICGRIELDVGKTILEKAPSVVTAMQRLEQMYNYVRQCVAACFRKLRLKMESTILSQREAIHLTSQIIQNTFNVFEGYLG